MLFWVSEQPQRGALLTPACTGAPPQNAGSKKPAIKKPAVSPLTEEELEAAKLQRAKSRRRANKFAD